MNCKPFEKYFNTYYNTFMYKIYLKDKNNDKIRTTLDQALDIVRQVSNMTDNMPQIVYIVGWNYKGHDSKYPAWDKVGEHCYYKDITNDPLTALRTMIRDARQYNAKMSVHINMDDAYPNSPLWDQYVAMDLINKHADGTLIIGDEWGGEHCYEISKTREWREGMAQKRIDGLLEMIPEIKESGTVHIDAFRPKASPGHGITLDDEIETCKNIFTHWHNAGVDVTNEFIALYDFVGYTPMVWALNLDEEGRLKYPASVLCGGSSNWNRRRKNAIYDKIGWIGSYSTPTAGCLWEEAWGESASRDLYGIPDGRPADNFEDFFLRTLPWHFLNRFERRELRQTKDVYNVIYSDGMESIIDVATGKRTVIWNGKTVIDGTNVCIENNWSDSAKKHFLLYSCDGGELTWTLPEKYASCTKGRLFRLSVEETEEIGSVALVNGTFKINIPAGEARLLELC